MALWPVAPVARGGVIFTNLVSFFRTNGSCPNAGLVQGADGNFYGTTPTHSGDIGPFSTIFKMTAGSTLTTVAGLDKWQSFGGLVLGTDGCIYGTTTGNGSGSVFQITTNDTFTTLVLFAGTNGDTPSSLIQGRDGNFYGTTSAGGTSNLGAIFQLTTNGSLATLVSFVGTNGAGPNALVQGADGNFYGTTLGGGAGYIDPAHNSYGTVFKVALDGTFTTLVSFAGTNGEMPAGLVQGSDGNFYGWTLYGGPQYAGGHPKAGNGTVFKVTPDGTFNALVLFDGTNGCAPASLVQGIDGNFYGTTKFGGIGYSAPPPAGPNGNGTVFKLTLDGTLTTLVLVNATNGYRPAPVLARATDGSLCGTTLYGGSSITQDSAGEGFGTAFQVTTGGVLSTLVSFNGTNGAIPNSLVKGNDGNFYATTVYGGALWHGRDETTGYPTRFGTVFRLSVPMPALFQPVTQTDDGALAFAWSAVAGQSYQLQYSTNLISSNWINLGDAITATNGTMSASDAIGSDLQRFYRVILLP
jgi:uncharacterized repeat protein (TIGR03803 family)